jgi:uncharacterized protein with HEPN domain
MKRKIRLYLKDILDNIDFAETLVKNKEYDLFAADITSQYAAVRCLEIIGEAAKQIPEILRSKYPQVPWRDMAGMRDKIAYFYFGVNINVVWKTITETIPVVRPFIQKAYEEMQDE